MPKRSIYGHTWAVEISERYQNKSKWFNNPFIWKCKSAPRMVFPGLPVIIIFVFLIFRFIAMAKKTLRNIHESENYMESYLIFILFCQSTSFDTDNPGIFLYSFAFSFWQICILFVLLISSYSSGYCLRISFTMVSSLFESFHMQPWVLLSLSYSSPFLVLECYKTWWEL